MISKKFITFLFIYPLTALLHRRENKTVRRSDAELSVPMGLRFACLDVIAHITLLTTDTTLNTDFKHKTVG